MRTVIVGMFAAIGVGFAPLPSVAGPLGNACTAAPGAGLVEQVSSYCRRHAVPARTSTSAMKSARAIAAVIAVSVLAGG
jgi:hypothetical protein